MKKFAIFNNYLLFRIPPKTVCKKVEFLMIINYIIFCLEVCNVLILNNY